MGIESSRIIVTGAIGQLVDYSEICYVLFTSKEWGMENATILRKYGGKFKYHLNKPDFGTGPGWVFIKSNTDSCKFLASIFNLPLNRLVNIPPPITNTKSVTSTVT